MNVTYHASFNKTRTSQGVSRHLFMHVSYLARFHSDAAASSDKRKMKY